MVNLMLCLVLISSAVFGQERVFFKTIEIGKGNAADPEFTLIQLKEINTAIVLHRPPRPTVCPVTEYREFLAMKINPKPKRYLIEDHVCQVTGPDSTTYNFGFIYQIVDYQGQLFYMEVIEGDKQKLKVKITDQRPTLKLEKRSSIELPNGTQERYRVDGKSLETEHSGAIK